MVTCGSRFAYSGGATLLLGRDRPAPTAGRSMSSRESLFTS